MNKDKILRDSKVIILWSREIRKVYSRKNKNYSSEIMIMSDKDKQIRNMKSMIYTDQKMLERIMTELLNDGCNL